MPKQYPLKIDTTFVETKSAGLAAKYLNSGEIQLRAGVEIAIAYLFAPLGAAIDGASRLRVEQLIAVSRTQSEIYFALALNRCSEDLSNLGSQTGVAASIETNSISNLDFEENINIDDEEF